MREISSSTRLTGIIGYPINHTLSPIMQNRAYTALGLDYLYVVFSVSPSDLAHAIQGLPALNIAGINVTIPYKQAVLPYLDEITPAAKKIGAVNTILVKKGKLIGYNTDGEGFIASLVEAGFMPAGKKILLLGAGGACRAVAVALAEAKAKEIIIAARNPVKAESLIKDTKLYEKTNSKSCSLFNMPPHFMEEADLIVNTTPLGMAPYENQLPSSQLDLLHPGQYVCDLIYNPLETIFLEQARLRGCKTINGIGMLVHQGAQAFTIWTGKPAPVNEMRQALLDYVGKSRKKIT